MAKKENDVVSQTFRALVESADRKFGRVRDLPLYGRAPQNHYFQKVFKAYMRLWKYQQENRSKLVDSGLNRWEIGEIASRIGQLYFNQYMRSSEARFLVEAYVFYEAILERKYFDARGSGKPKVDVGVRFKELRFYARFLLVALIFNKVDMVRLLAERFKGLVDDSMTKFRVSCLFISFLLCLICLCFFGFGRRKCVGFVDYWGEFWLEMFCLCFWIFFFVFFLGGLSCSFNSKVLTIDFEFFDSS